jgi:hypothetical protein
VKTLIASLAFAFLICGVGCSSSPNKTANQPIGAAKLRIVEGYPSSIINAINVNRQVLETNGVGVSHLQSVVSRSRTWPQRRAITVAFQGGASTLRSQIAQSLQPWADAANITFDFGPRTDQGQFREWSDSDTTYAADVRIGFRDGSQGGYWSLVGRDSTNPALVKPNQQSMNFEGFPNSLPQDWQSTVLHEFGHALGFEHEHQSPVSPCEQEFHWNDDAGYTQTRDMYGQYIPDSLGKRPGIYTVLEGPPNKWSKDQIDFNLRQLPNSADWILSSFDKKSIMKYQFDGWMFVNGPQSACYSDENMALSPEDIAAAQKIYPRDTPSMTAAAHSQSRALQQLVMLNKLPAELRTRYKAMLGEVSKAPQH